MCIQWNWGPFPPKFSYIPHTSSLVLEILLIQGLDWNSTLEDKRGGDQGTNTALERAHCECWLKLTLKYLVLSNLRLKASFVVQANEKRRTSQRKHENGGSQWGHVPLVLPVSKHALAALRDKWLSFTRWMEHFSLFFAQNSIILGCLMVYVFLSLLAWGKTAKRKTENVWCCWESPCFVIFVLRRSIDFRRPELLLSRLEKLSSSILLQIWGKLQSIL